ASRHPRVARTRTSCAVSSRRPAPRRAFDVMVPSSGVQRRFGRYGGRYVPETLMPALAELEHAWLEARADRAFGERLDYLLRSYAGRPTPLYAAERLSEQVGSQVWLKREDLLHTGAHKINNALGQALL